MGLEEEIDLKKIKKIIAYYIDKVKNNKLI